MNSFDVQILHFLNQFTCRSQVFDSLTVLLATNNLLKGGMVMTVLWWAYYSPDKNKLYNREYLVPTATDGARGIASVAYHTLRTISAGPR